MCVQANRKLETVELSRSKQTSEQQTLYASLRSLQDQIIREEDKLLVARQGLERLFNRRESRGKEGKRIHERRSKLLLEIEEAESSHQEKLLALEEFQRQYTEIQVRKFFISAAIPHFYLSGRNRSTREGIARFRARVSRVPQ